MNFPAPLQFLLLALTSAWLGVINAAPALLASPALAQAQGQPNPLEEPLLDDPLIPAIQRPLSALERRILGEELDKLNLEAKAQLTGENEEAAFEIWYRELRLRRQLGPLAEIEALGRVGAVAWERMRGTDVQIVTKRLQAIQTRAENKAPLTPEFLTAFARAYGEVHSLDSSLDIYQKILAYDRQRGDTKAQEETLNVLGELYLAKFDYVRAAEIYEVLVDIAQAEDNAYTEGLYLQKLASIYYESSQPQNSVQVKEALANNYLKNKNFQALPGLKIAIADDYAALEQAEKASQNYQEAFSLAWSLQQFGTAGEALQKLALLYKNHDREEYALRIYNELVKVEQESYNYYGQMRAYDYIGQIYLERQDYRQALAAFQKALTIARTLKYQEDYFQSQIEKAKVGR